MNILKSKILFVLKQGIEIKKEYDKAHIGAYSAQAAFFVLVSAVPLVMLTFVVMGVFVPQLTEQIIYIAGDFFAQQAKVWVVKTLQEIQNASAIPLVSVTMVFLVWSATRGIRSIADGINTIYGSQRQYNIVQRVVRSVGYAVLFAAVVAVSVFLLLSALPAEEKLHTLLGEKLDIVLVVVNSRRVILFVTLALLFAFAYKGLAHSRIRLKNQFGGAVLAAAGWMIYSFGYSVYIRHFSKYSLLYGSLGAVMLFMLWLYMCMNILLCGALFNKIRSEKCD